MQRWDHVTPRMHKGEDRCKYCCTGHPLWQCLACGIRCGEYWKQNNFKTVFKLKWQQWQGWWGRKTSHDISQESDLHIVETEEQDRNFDAARVKPLYFKICHMSHIIYKVDPGADGNLMPLKIFKTLFSR